MYYSTVILSIFSLLSAKFAVANPMPEAVSDTPAQIWPVPDPADVLPPHKVALVPVTHTRDVDITKRTGALSDCVVCWLQCALYTAVCAAVCAVIGEEVPAECIACLASWGASQQCIQCVPKCEKEGPVDCSGFTNTCVGSSGPFTGKPGLCVGNGFTKKAAGNIGCLSGHTCDASVHNIKGCMTGL